MEPTIRTITVAEAFDSPVFAALCDEYRAESLRNPDMVGALPDREGYARMVDAGHEVTGILAVSDGVVAASSTASGRPPRSGATGSPCCSASWRPSAS